MVQTTTSHKKEKVRSDSQGGRRKTLSEEMKNQLLEWIFECRSKMLCVLRKSMRIKRLMVGVRTHR